MFQNMKTIDANITKTLEMLVLVRGDEDLLRGILSDIKDAGLETGSDAALMAQCRAALVFVAQNADGEDLRKSALRLAEMYCEMDRGAGFDFAQIAVIARSEENTSVSALRVLRRATDKKIPFGTQTCELVLGAACDKRSSAEKSAMAFDVLKSTLHAPDSATFSLERIQDFIASICSEKHGEEKALSALSVLEEAVILDRGAGLDADKILALASGKKNPASVRGKAAELLKKMSGEFDSEVLSRYSLALIDLARTTRDKTLRASLIECVDTLCAFVSAKSSVPSAEISRNLDDWLQREPRFSGRDIIARCHTRMEVCLMKDPAAAPRSVLLAAIRRNMGFEI